MNLTNRTKLYFCYGFILFISIIQNLVPIQPAFSNNTANAAEASDKNIQQILQALDISQSNDSQNNLEYLTEVLQVFGKTLESEDEATSSLLKKWNHYLIEVTSYSTDSHIKAMQSLQAEYSKAITTLGNVFNQQTKKEKKYSSSWIDDLTNHFGKDFIKKNRDSVTSSLKAFIVCNEDYKKELKDLIYAEAMLLGSYKQYYDLFLDYYNEKLDKNSQKKLETRKNLAEAIIKITSNKPLTSMYEGSDLQNILAENEALQLNNEVYNFLKNHPLSYTLSDIRACKDFAKAYPHM